LEVGDVIVSVNDKSVSSASQLRNSIGLVREGEKVSLKYFRDGKTRDVEVNVGKASLLGKGLKFGRKLEEKLDGVQFADTNENNGVRVTHIDPGSTGMQAGLREGDLIVEANRIKVKNLEDLRDALKASKDSLLLRIERGQSALFLVIR
ncbi:MAG: PDZ domain-containing protein, partial [Gammaproteobacteria bacterium]|nr:PDZ domain-containing protein [Gammaproteobacteria bacterium]